MTAIKHAYLIGSLTVLALSACATSTARRDAQVTRATPHQDPNQPNPDAVPKGLIEWVDYVCSIPDPEARKQAIHDSEEQRGWTFTCPEEKPKQGQ